MYKMYQYNKEMQHLQRYKLLISKTRLKPSCKISANFITSQIEKNTSGMSKSTHLTGPLVYAQALKFAYRSNSRLWGSSDIWNDLLLKRIIAVR